jgi:hypothetical protein
MPRRKGHGGQTSRESPEKETEAIHIESEPEGGMGDHGEDRVSRYWNPWSVNNEN